MNANAKNLQIKTVSVSLQVITIDDKQMTLSVFRQIPEGDSLFDYPTGKLKAGIAFWGKVRYQFGKGPNVWAVGVEDGELFRYGISTPEWLWSDTLRHQVGRDGVEDADFEIHEGIKFLGNLRQFYIAV